MRPYFEAVPIEPDASWTFSYRDLQDGIPYEWHYHPEYELTLTLNSRGYRCVGDDISDYEDADLVLVGPGVAHTWRSTASINAEAPHRVMVMKFTQAWVDALTTQFPEMSGVKTMLERIFQGLKFSDDAVKRVIPIIEDLAKRSPSARFLKFLEVLVELASDSNAKVLGQVIEGRNSPVSFEGKVVRALNYIHKNYRDPMKVCEIADASCLSLSGFQRMFRRHTGCGPIEYLVRLRIGKACALLLSTERPIGDVASEVGFLNISLFNRQFLKLKCETPSQFRERHRSVSLHGTT